MALWHGYFTITRANLGDANWDALIVLVRELRENTTDGGAHYEFTERMRIDGDAYNFEARFNEGAVSFDKFANKLATAFDVDVEDITINESLETHGIEATYAYSGQDRFKLQLMGCAADDDLCSWQQSRDETDAMITSQPGEWETNP